MIPACLSVMEADAQSSMNGSPNAHSKPPPVTNGSGPRNSKGWDGKLRVDRRAVVTNAEAMSDPEHSDGDAPPVEQINADEGRYKVSLSTVSANMGAADLLEDYEPDSDVCRCHFRIEIENITDTGIHHRRLTSSTAAFPLFLLYDSIASTMSRYRP